MMVAKNTIYVKAFPNLFKNGGSTQLVGNEIKYLPRSFKLNQNYPNPFNPVTIIGFYLSNPERVLLRIFDINGKHIKTLIDNQFLESGYHKYSLQSQKLDLSSGIYMYTIETDKWNSTKKMLLLK